MKRSRITITYKGMKIRVLGWGNTFSYWLFTVGEKRRVTRVAINSGFKSKHAAIKTARQNVNLLEAA